jgi:UME (NUC010) domain
LPAKLFQVRRALQVVAGMHFGKETRQKKANAVGRFLNSQALGLMPRLTDVINNNISSGGKEQIRCLRAIEEMIAVSKEYSQIARPQVTHYHVYVIQGCAKSDLDLLLFACCPLSGRPQGGCILLLASYASSHGWRH